MRVIETLPIYFTTDDARINAFLAKNRLHHDLSTPCTLRKIPLGLRAVNEGGNGRIRLFLLLLAGAVLTYSIAWGYWL